MKRYMLLAALASVVLVGCGHKDETVITDADGSKVAIGQQVGGETKVDLTGKDGSKVTETIDPNSGVKIEGTGKDGSTYTQTSNAAGTTIQGTDKDGNKVSETIGANGMSASDGKGGSVNTGAGIVKESDLGLPFYPGSQESKDSGLSMIADDPKAKSVISYRSTHDSPSHVIDFYKGKIPGGQTSSTQTGAGSLASISGKLSGGVEVSVMATSDGKKDTVIMVTSKTPKS